MVTAILWGYPSGETIYSAVSYTSSPTINRKEVLRKSIFLVCSRATSFSFDKHQMNNIFVFYPKLPDKHHNFFFCISTKCITSRSAEYNNNNMPNGIPQVGFGSVKCKQTLPLPHRGRVIWTKSLASQSTISTPFHVGYSCKKLTVRENNIEKRLIEASGE